VTSPTAAIAVVAQRASAGSTALVLVDASGVPEKGTLQVGDDPTSIGYVRNSVNDSKLKLLAPLGHDVSTGPVVRLFAEPPTPGPFGFSERVVGEGAGCSIGAAGPSGGMALVLGAAVLAAGRRRDP
jgi:hypothetical protein